MLTAPPGVERMNVATDYVESYRRGGPPGYGVNEREIAGRAATAALCLAPFAAMLLVLVQLMVRARQRRARRRRARPRRRGPPTAGPTPRPGR